MKNTNLTKITSVCRAFHEQFGDTLEGRGYLTVLDMLERAGLTRPDVKEKPTTVKELVKKLVKMLSDAGVMEKYNVFIDIMACENFVTYKTYSSVLGAIEGDSPAGFLAKVEEQLEDQREKIAQHQNVRVEAAAQEDISLK